MQSIISSQEESLHQGFDVTLPAGHTARYVTDRAPSVFFPSGGSTYSPSQTRELQFTLSSFASFADLSTLMLKHDSAKYTQNPHVGA